MIPSHVRLILAVLVLTGNITYYGAEHGERMEFVAQRQGINLAEHETGIALPRARADLAGHSAWLRDPDGQWHGPFVVVDWAHPHDVLHNDLLQRECAEVSWHTFTNHLGLDAAWPVAPGFTLVVLPAGQRWPWTRHVPY